MQIDDPHNVFAVATSVSDGQALLTVRGEVDHIHAPVLEYSLNALIDQGHRDLVVDLSGVDFLDSSGLKVLEAAVHRLERAEGSLALRSPSPIVRRLLGIVGLDDVIHVERSVEDGHESPSGATDTQGAELGDLGLGLGVRQLVAMPSDNQAVDAALRMIVALAEASIGGADGVSVSLHRDGHLSSVATTDPTIAELDAEQYATGEGPCVAASVAGHRFHVEALAEEERWPSFIKGARTHGINAILSSPLLSLNEPVGALNIYSRAPRAFSPEDEQLASVFTAQASIVVSEARISVSTDELSLRLTKALHARKVIAQAQGIIMERLSLNPDAAYNELLDFSRQSNIPLRQRAEDVVAAAQEKMAAAAQEKMAAAAQEKMAAVESPGLS